MILSNTWRRGAGKLKIGGQTKYDMEMSNMTMIRNIDVHLINYSWFCQTHEGEVLGSWKLVDKLRFLYFNLYYKTFSVLLQTFFILTWKNNQFSYRTYGLEINRLQAWANTCTQVLAYWHIHCFSVVSEFHNPCIPCLGNIHLIRNAENSHFQTLSYPM